MLYPRTILQNIIPFLTKKYIILLVGSRQVGKTSLMHLIKQELLKRKIAADEQILFFDLERGDDLSLLEDKTADQFADYAYQSTGLKRTTKLYIFIDEIQYLSNPSPFFKLLADHHPNLRLILSGSSSLDIKKIFTDRLTGRKILFQVRPLSFREYLVFQEYNKQHLFKFRPDSVLDGKKDHITKASQLSDFARKLTEIYEQFVLYGSYPAPSLLESESIRETLIKEIRDTYVRKDISDILKVENIPGFNRLLHILAAQSGNLINIHELSSSSGMARETVERHLFFMQETFILSLLTPYSRNPRQELIKMPKIYMNDTGIRNILLNNLSPPSIRPDTGALVENAVYNQLSHLELPIYFWRTKTKVEADFVIKLGNGNIVPIEVKYQSMKKPNIPTGLRAFIKRYKPPRAFVVTKSFSGQTKIEGVPIYFLPAFCW